MLSVSQAGSYVGQGFTESLGGLRGLDLLGRLPERSRIVCGKKEATVPSPKTAFETLDGGEWTPGSETREREALSNCRCPASGTARGLAVGAPHATSSPAGLCMAPATCRLSRPMQGLSRHGAHSRPAWDSLGEALLPSSPEWREAGPCPPRTHTSRCLRLPRSRVSVSCPCN